MSSYHFLTAVKIRKMVGPFLAPCVRAWLFFVSSGLDLAPWQKVDLTTFLARLFV